MRHDSGGPNGFAFPLHSGGRNGTSPFWTRFGQAAPISPHVEEPTIYSGKVQIERKVFTFSLKENARGRFLRITEEAKGRHNTIIIPATGLEDVQRILNELVRMGSG